MARHLAAVLAKPILRGRSATSSKLLKGFVAVYVGETEKKRFLVPVSHLNEPLFRDLLNKAEEEFGFNYPSSGLTIPCSEDTFIHVTSCLSRS